METKFTLTKNFKFEAAHRLSKEYFGKCSRLHGHSWTGHVCISGPKTKRWDMLYDYGELKLPLGAIEDFLDHRTLLFTGDPLFEFMEREYPEQVIGFDANPTSEHLAWWIFQKLKNHNWPDGVILDHVLIKETCTTSCLYSEF